MTTFRVPTPQLPPVAHFLERVCPGPADLDENVHLPFPPGLSDKIKQIDNLPWPLQPQGTLTLDKLYLHIARNPYTDKDPLTYASIPLHVKLLFQRVVATQQKGHELELHIGASVNPLAHDAFPLVHLNPGSLSLIIEKPEQQKNTFDKVASGLNRFLRSASSSAIAHFAPMADSLDILEQRSDDHQRLLVAAHGDILSVMQLDARLNYAHTCEKMSTAALLPMAEADKITYSCKPYKKVVEQPLLRARLPHMATALTAYCTGDVYVAIGLLGELVILNLSKSLMRRIDLGSCFDGECGAVTALCALSTEHHEVLVVAGLANGEVVIVDPHGNVGRDVGGYVKAVEGRDAFATYFRRFDLSPFGAGEGGGCIVGHVKFGHKAITSLCSTLEVGQPRAGLPLLLAVALDDGLVRVVDLLATFERDYGDSLAYSHLLVLDVVANYFQHGVRHVAFSGNHRFLAVAGLGDMVEIFRVSYYNVHGMLTKRGRLRSNTVTLATSHVSLQGDDEAYPPALKDICIVGRLKGHCNTVEKVAFVEGQSSLYRLVLCGNDGKLFVWDFDAKALPLVKKPQNRRRPHGKTLPQAHLRTRLWDDGVTQSFSALGINTLLSPAPEQLAVFSVYRLLRELRLQRAEAHAGAVVHAVVEDTALPLIQIPLLEMDLGCVVPDGRIGNFYVGASSLWVFCRSGDTLRYTL